MNLNKKLNLKLKNEIHLITRWEDKGNYIDLHFGWEGARDCEKVRNKLETSKQFKVTTVHGWRLNWLKVREVK